jgi:hypothetical protein
MKKRFLGIALAVFATGTLLSSFTSSEGGTGGVAVTVMFDGQAVEGALVGIASSQENLENSKYIYENETNAKGSIHFHDLAAGTYYLDADYSTDEVSAYAEATVTVTDAEVAVTITLE